MLYDREKNTLHQASEMYVIYTSSSLLVTKALCNIMKYSYIKS